MENEEKVVNEEKIVKEGGNNKGLLLGIIAVLVVALAVLAVYMFFNKPTPKNVYFRVIDEFSSSVNKSIDKLNTSKKEEIKYNVGFNMKTTNSSYNEIANIINKMKLSSSVQSDFGNKKLNANIDVLYNNSSLIDANVYLNNKDMYAELPSLYDKLIKMPLDNELNLEDIWNTLDKNSYKTIVNELTNIIKNNLKEEYFSNSVEKITVLNNEVEVSKQVLDLNGKNIVELQTNIINAMLNNDKLLNALSKTTNMTVSDIKLNLNETKKEVQEAEGFVAEIYLNIKNNKIEYITIKSGEEKIELVKASDDTFNIMLGNNKVGALTLSNKEVNLNIDYEGTKITYKITNTSLEINGSFEDVTFSIKLNGNDKKGNLVMNVNSKEEKIDLTINADYEKSSIKSVQEKDYSNYVELDKLTENDMNSIMTKLYENQNLMTLIQDISSLTAAEAY